MTFGLWTVALALATLGQVIDAQVGCGIGIGEDICTHKRPHHIARLPLVVRPAELPRPVIEISTPRPIITLPTVPPTLPPLPVPPLLPLGGPCSCKRTLVRPAIVPKPVCSGVCTNNYNQKTITNNRVVVGGGYNSASSSILGGASALVGGAVDSLYGGHSSGSILGGGDAVGSIIGGGSSILGGASAVSSIIGGGSAVSSILGGGSAVSSILGGGNAVSSIIGGDDSVSTILDGGDSISTIVGGGDSINTIVGGGDSVSTIIGGADSAYGIDDTIVGGLGRSVGGTTFIENSGYTGSGSFVENVDVLGDSTIVQTGGPGSVVETIVDGPYVDTIVGGRRRCINVPYDSVDVGRTETRRDTSQLPADAVSLAIAYNLAKKACEQSEDKLFYGFRQIPKELPRRVINRRIIGRRFPEEGNLYTINGEVVELKAPSAITTPKSLAEEAAEDLLDLVAEEQEQGTDFVLPIRKVTLGEIGYAPAKRRSPTFVDVPPVVSDVVDDVVEAVGDAVGDAVNSAVKSVTCADGFRAGNVAVLPVPKRELMLSRPKLETLLEPCSSEEEYGTVPQAVQYTACRKTSHRSSSSSSSGLLSKIVAKLA